MRLFETNAKKNTPTKDGERNVVTLKKGYNADEIDLITKALKAAVDDFMYKLNEILINAEHSSSESDTSDDAVIKDDIDIESTDSIDEDLMRLHNTLNESDES